MKRVVLLFLIVFCSVVSATTYYVAPKGYDGNPGTKDKPWATWGKAFSSTSVGAGDTVYFRGGVYVMTITDGTGYVITRSGTESNPICYFNYPGEVPKLDCASVTKVSGGLNFGLTTNEPIQYVNFRGLTIRNVWSTAVDVQCFGFRIQTTNRVNIERFTVYNIHGIGYEANTSYDLHYINCDAYNCCDSLASSSPGNRGSGFSSMNVFTQDGSTYYKNCRAWNCSDQGFVFHNNSYVELDGCWSFSHGYMLGDGSGFKLGFIDSRLSIPIQRKLINCLAAYNRLAGINTNEGGAYISQSMQIYNNTVYHNGFYGHSLKGSGIIVDNTSSTNAEELKRIFRNNISFANEDRAVYADLNALYTHEFNSWDTPPGVIVTDADFLTVDSTGITGERKPDGSLPDINFMKLASGSDLIDAGKYVELAYAGTAPDLGFSEYLSGSAVPPDPVYLSSVIESATPARLEITYSLTLANIVPAASAFTVLVNDAVRSVNSVAISGAKVVLTLASPVAFGDEAYLTYTKPSVNPIQTVSAAQAASLSVRQVTNNVTSTSPVYVSSFVGNEAPSKLEMIYNSTLANIVPATSAFIVIVNSVLMAVSSVTISGTRVILLLTGTIKYGDIITVAYTKPASNPLQTTSGGQAVSLSPQRVANRVTISNVPPVVVVNYQSTSYSGFVNEINASRSYDINNDNLSFTWIAPSNVPTSSTSGSTIKYLSPFVSSPQAVDFTLIISDGKANQSKIIPVNILPYKPELEVAEILNIEASFFQAPFYPYNIIDGNIGTMWAANGENQWLMIELKHSFDIQLVKLAFQPGQRKESYFDILGSNDKVNWESILIKAASCSFSGDLQIFEFPPSKTGKEFKFIKLIGQGNSTDSWNYISELRIFGYRHRNNPDYENLAVKIYPNPAIESVTIRIDQASLVPDFVQIIDASGMVVLRVEIDPAPGEVTIPLNLLKGIYIIQLVQGNLTLFTQKLIISK